MCFTVLSKRPLTSHVICVDASTSELCGQPIAEVLINHVTIATEDPTLMLVFRATALSILVGRQHRFGRGGGLPPSDGSGDRGRIFLRNVGFVLCSVTSVAATAIAINGLDLLLTISMQKSPAYEVAGRSASQGILSHFI